MKSIFFIGSGFSPLILAIVAISIVGSSGPTGYRQSASQSSGVVIPGTGYPTGSGSRERSSGGAILRPALPTQQQQSPIVAQNGQDNVGQKVQRPDFQEFSAGGAGRGQKTGLPLPPQKDGSTSPNSWLTNSALCASVKTANGLLRGKLVKSKTGKDVCAFLGIPYGKPPLGTLRFKRPLPKGKWEGTLDATKLPNACWQPVSEADRGTDWYPNTKLSEDCLYLNLWVPVAILGNKDAHAQSPGAGATVMIWIHGGGLTTGSGSFELYNGEILAGDQQVIVASINYRLGPFGFLYLNSAEAPGNVGLIDQSLAIKWIKDNVAHFDGNPDEMTIFGESAGSMSVSYQLISPLSRGLFKRAILQSGVANGPIMFWDRQEALDGWVDFSQKMGCWPPAANDSHVQVDIAEIVKCLQGVEPHKITNFELASRKFIDRSGSATVDGYFLTDTPTNLLRNYAEGARADIIIGNVKDEGSIFLLMDLPQFFPFSPTPPTINYDTFVTVMRLIFREMSAYQQNVIISRYTNWINLDDSAENLRRIVAATGDYLIVCPAIEFATHWAARGHRVYSYDFTQRSSNSPMPAWFGVKHCDEIEYVFGRVIAEPTRPKSEQDLSREIQQLFTKFAKTGVPSDKWETFTRAHPVFLDLNATLISSQTTPNVFGPRAEPCAFWNIEFPLIQKYYKEAQPSSGENGGQLVPLMRGQPAHSQSQLEKNSGHCASSTQA